MSYWLYVWCDSFQKHNVHTSDVGRGTGLSHLLMENICINKTEIIGLGVCRHTGYFKMLILFKTLFDLPFIFSFRVKLPCIFLSSASMVSPPMSASRCVRFTMPTPNTISVTCWGSELTKLLLRPSRLGGVSPSDSNTSRHGGSAGLRPPSVNRRIGPKAVNIKLEDIFVPFYAIWHYFNNT